MHVWPLRRLLQHEDGAPITTPQQWQEKAQDIRTRFLRTLGPRPESQRLRGFTVGPSVVEDHVRRTLITAQVDEQDFMEHWLLEPAYDSIAHERGAVLALHQTTDMGKDEVAGLGGVPDFAYGKHLAQRGWTVLAPDNFALKNRYAAGLRGYETTRLYERFPHWSAVGKLVADAQMSLDLMQQLPRTMNRPISVIGHSLGGHQAIFLAAADERPVQIVCNCGVYPFADSACRSQWFRTEWFIYFKDEALKKSVLEGPVPVWDFHEVAALAAPRRLCVIGATNDVLVKATHGLHRLGEEVHQVYSILDASNRLALITHNEDHSFTSHNRAFAYMWLEAGLASE